MCPCKAGDKRHPKDKGCHIAQCISAVLGEDDDLYAVTQRLCACEYKWPQCSLPEHISALDVLAECQADADQYVSAFSTALGLIRLSPTSAAVSRLAHENQTEHQLIWLEGLLPCRRYSS
jgi:hypothetical protein